MLRHGNTILGNVGVPVPQLKRRNMQEDFLSSAALLWETRMSRLNEANWRPENPLEEPLAHVRTVTINILIAA
jgi:hypothetical protein